LAFPSTNFSKVGAKSKISDAWLAVTGPVMPAASLTS
jgi:hypothetical protein